MNIIAALVAGTLVLAPVKGGGEPRAFEIDSVVKLTDGSALITDGPETLTYQFTASCEGYEATDTEVHELTKGDDGSYSDIEHLYWIEGLATEFVQSSFDACSDSFTLGIEAEVPDNVGNYTKTDAVSYVKKTAPSPIDGPMRLSETVQYEKGEDTTPPDESQSGETPTPEPTPEKTTPEPEPSETPTPEETPEETTPVDTSESGGGTKSADPDNPAQITELRKTGIASVPVAGVGLLMTAAGIVMLRGRLWR